MKKTSMLVFIIISFLLTNLNANLSQFKKNTFKDSKSGKLIDEIIVPGLPQNKRISSPIANLTRSSVILENVPAFNWSFGCSATSAAMMSGYYDNTGYPANYSGQTNNGVMPQNNSSWPDWNDGYDNRHQCPLSATHNNLDGKTTNGHVDRFWKRYGKSSSDGETYADSYTDDPTSTYELCTADFMGTNQDWWNNSDGSTTFFYNSDGSPLINYSGSENSSPRRRDGIRGLRIFFESRGYTVTTNYNQYLKEEGKTYGFSFQDFENEIDSGNPVLIQIEGHTMLGLGYDNADSTVYIHDTWDYNTHTMKWGGSYSGMHHYGISVIHLEPKQTTSAPVFSPAGGTFTSTQNIEISLNSQPTSGTTTIKYTTDGNDPTENSSLYTVPINIPLESTMTIKAITLNTLWDSSNISSEDYLVTGKVDTPSISPESGTYYSSVNCTIDCSHPENSEIYYTVDGSNPVIGNSETIQYSGPFQINSDTVVKAIGVKTDWENSELSSKNYTIEPGAPNLEFPENNSVSASYDANLQWTTPSSGAVPDGYKIAISTANPPTNYIDVGNVLSWQPSPHIDWNQTYYWKVMTYSTDLKGNGQESSIYSFTVSDGDTGNGSGSNGGSGNVEVDIEPIKIDNKPIDPDIAISSENDLSVDIVVDDIPQNAGLPDPNDVSLSYRINFTGSGLMDFTLYFSGLSSIGIQPNKLFYYDGSTWSEISSPTWDYNNEKVFFSLNIGRRSANEIVLNKEDATLPVELSSFYAINSQEKYVKILWATESENELLGFNILRAQVNNMDNAIKLNPTLILPSNTSNHSEYSFIDRNVKNNNTYFYWLEEIDDCGESIIFDPIKFDVIWDNDENHPPENLPIYGINLIYPNPFNPTTTITYCLPEPSKVTIDIFNIKGAKIYTIDDGFRKENKLYSIQWNGSTFSGKISSGIYFVRLKTNKIIQTRRILLLK